MRIHVLAAPLPGQENADNVPGKEVKNDPSAWAFAPTSESQKKPLAPWLHPDPAPVTETAWVVNQQLRNLCLSLSLSNSSFQINKINLVQKCECTYFIRAEERNFLNLHAERSQQSRVSQINSDVPFKIETKILSAVFSIHSTIGNPSQQEKK